MTRAMILSAALVCAAATARAQGTLSSQGYGYPAGPFSTRSLTLGGSIGEIDPISTLNPAALTTWGPSGFYGQFGPEWRSVQAGGTTDQSTVIRFPLFAGALHAGPDWVFGLSFSNLLDRTWATQNYGYYHLAGGDSVAYTQNFASQGAITNVRLAAGWRLSNSLRIGLGGHFITGQTSLTILELFADTGYASFQQVTVVNASGTAVSAGVEWSPIPPLAFALSGQFGGTLHARRNDTLVADARVPSRAGASLVFAGITGVTLAADAEYMQWSNMNGLAQSAIKAVDSWDYGLGGEIRVASMGGADVPLRVGIRHRTLPFQADLQTVTENAFSAGVGLPVARGRGRFDLGLIRMWRSAPTLDAKEHAWSLSVGVLVRP